MGVDGLWKLLAPAGRRIDIDTLRGDTLAIDASIWLTQFIKAMRGSDGIMVKNAHLLGCLRRILKLMFHKIKPVFVFDGGVPLLKKRTVEMRKQKTEQSSNLLNQAARKLLLNTLYEQNARKKEKTDAVSSFVVPPSKKNEKEFSSSSEDSEDDGIVWSRPDIEPKYAPQHPFSDDQSRHSDLLGGADDVIAQLPLKTDGLVDLSPISVLPERLQYEVIARLKDKRRQRESKRNELIPVANDPQKYSTMQLKHFLKDVKMKNNLDKMQQELVAKGGEGKRIASEAGIRYVLIDTSVSSPVSSSVTSPVQEEPIERFLPADLFDDNPVLETSTTRRSTDALSSAMNTAPGLTSWAAMAVKHAFQKRNHSLYHQKQNDAKCGPHCLNNLVQESVFTSERLLKIARELDKQESELFGSQLDSEKVSNSIDANGNFSVQVLSTALMRDYAYEVVFDVKKIDSYFKSSSEQIIGFICCLNNHWIAIRSIAGTSWNFDSRHQEPVSISCESLSVYISNLRSSGWSVYMVIQGVKKSSKKRSRNDYDNTELEMAIQASLREKSIDESNSPYVYEMHDSDDNDSFHTASSQVSGQKHNEIVCEVVENKAKMDMRRGSNETPIAWRNRIMAMRKQSSEPLESWIKQNQQTSQVEPVDDHVESEVVILEKPIKRLPVNVESEAMLLEKPIKRLPVNTESEVVILEKQIKRLPVNTESEVVILEKQIKRLPVNVESEAMLLEKPIKRLPVNTESEVVMLEKPIKRLPVNTESEGMLLEKPIKILPVNAESEVVLEKPVTAFPEEISFNDDVETLLETERQILESQDDNPLETSFETPALKSHEDRLTELHRENAQLIHQRNTAQRDTDIVTPLMLQEVKDMLELLGLPYVESPMEAEAQCAALEAAGVVDGVVTEDCDAFLFGAKNVYKNIFVDNKFVEAYKSNAIEGELGFDRNRLINLALLLGSDYTPGIKGIGIVNAAEVVQSFPDLIAFRRWIHCTDGLIPDEKDEIEQTEALISFKHAHKNAKKRWIVSDSFPSNQVVEAYTKPVVVNKPEPFVWHTPDINGMRLFCSAKFGWNAEHTNKELKKPLESFAGRQMQTTLDKFVVRYTDESRVAAIRSKRLKNVIKSLSKTVNEVTYIE